MFETIYGHRRSSLVIVLHEFRVARLLRPAVSTRRDGKIRVQYHEVGIFHEHRSSKSDRRCPHYEAARPAPIGLLKCRDCATVRWNAHSRGLYPAYASYSLSQFAV